MIGASISHEQAMAMLLAALPTLAVMSAIAFAPMKAMKAMKKPEKKGSAKQTAAKSRASPCKSVVGKLHYAVKAAKTPEAYESAQQRLNQYKAMCNKDKHEFSELFDLNNGSVSWMASYLESHSTFTKEAARQVEGMMTRIIIWPYIQANSHIYRSHAT